MGEIIRIAHAVFTGLDMNPFVIQRMAHMLFSFFRGDDPSVGRGIFAMGKRGSNVSRGIDEAEASEECEELNQERAHFRYLNAELGSFTFLWFAMGRRETRAENLTRGRNAGIGKMEKDRAFGRWT